MITASVCVILGVELNTPPDAQEGFVCVPPERPGPALGGLHVHTSRDIINK